MTADAKTPTHPLLLLWTNTMRAESLSERTITERPRIVVRAAAALEVAETELSTAGIIGWLGNLPSPGTRATYFGALRSWSRWLVTHGHRADDPTTSIRTPRVPRRMPRPVATENLTTLLTETRINRRTRVMIHLAAYQGLRVHEVAKLRGEDVDLRAGTLRVVGKGGVEAHLPLHPQIAADATAMPERGWWFPAAKGPGPMRRDSVSAIVSRAMDRAGMRDTAHQLRHWYGTELLRSGTDVRVAQTLLRHASLATTALYTAVDSDQQREAVARLPVLPSRRTTRGPAPRQAPRAA